ncbi:MAG: hypothetical protein K6G56_08655 [Clostridiales bacterium]|nr:hypothetical protein [Clostridiales bacterium]
MDCFDASSFIEAYCDLYFSPDQPEKRKALGIDKLNGTDEKAEDYVMEQMRSGVYGKTAFAWKAGKTLWDESKKVIAFRPEFEGEDKKTKCYRNGYGKPVCKSDFENYCAQLEKNRETILLHIDKEEWEKAYCKALIAAPTNFGPVNIINAIFFISRGKAPIYDSFAHRAVRSLIMGIDPEDVYLGTNPNKEEIKSVVKMYKEYMLLLKEAFPEYINMNNNNEFIPRKLDQALWVYGHIRKEKND